MPKLRKNIRKGRGQKSIWFRPNHTESVGQLQSCSHIKILFNTPLVIVLYYVATISGAVVSSATKDT